MKGARSLILVPVLLALASVPGAAAPQAGPCAPGMAYDPACDVNQDGQITIADIQLTAGHWNQSGTWVSDNQHNHLGQTWTGAGNSLTINGAFGASSSAPLIVSNTTGSGLRVESVYNVGVSVGTTGGDGINIYHAGSPSSQTGSALKNGVEVQGAEGAGFFIGRADASGFRVSSAAEQGLYVGSAGWDGVFVTSAGGVGVYANTTQANGEWGFYTNDAIHGSNVLLHSLSLVAQVAGPDSLTPGDVVAVAGVTDPVPGSTVRTPLVRLADATFSAVVGVVESHVALTKKPGQPQPAEGATPTETPASELRSVEGPAQAGDYVAITVLGAARVKVQEGAAIQPGQRLTVSATPGQARALQSKLIEGMMVTEGASVIGAALEAPKDGLVWVLVNPQ